MKHALFVTFALVVLLTPAAFAQRPAAPEVSSMEAALDLPDAPASSVAAPGEVPSCLPEQQQPLEQGSYCEEQCRKEYEECLIFCSKNPCFVACETVLDICLDNCH
jgi:hypothetical protein